MKEKDPHSFYHLVAHIGFRDWVQNPNKESNHFWKKWMEKNPESISEVKKAREFIERMNFQNAQLSSDELEELLGKVIAKENPADRSGGQMWKGSSLIFGQWFRVAAILIISVTAVAVFNGFVSELQEEPMHPPTEWITLENPKGRKSKIKLPDGTIVDLSYESRLKFPRTFNGDFRKVELSGEAFFEVVSNDAMPFIIQTYGLETEVVGTSFNIKSPERGKETAISLVSGKVKIRKVKDGPTKKDKYIYPGEQLIYHRNSGQMTLRDFDLESVTSWKEGILIFKDAGLEEFVDQLERWFGVDFLLYGSPPKEWKVNGRYQDEKLDDILIGMKFVYGLEYKIQGKNVILKFNNYGGI